MPRSNAEIDTEDTESCTYCNFEGSRANCFGFCKNCGECICYKCIHEMAIKFDEVPVSRCFDCLRRGTSRFHDLPH